MKRVIAALIAGITLGATGVAGATVANSYWEHTTTVYQCRGITAAYDCKQKGGPKWEAVFGKGRITVLRGDKIVSTCTLSYGSLRDACAGDWEINP